MKVLIAASAFREDVCGDPVAAVASFPWPAQTTFRVITAAAPVHPPVAGLMAEGFDIPEVQRDIDTASENAAAAAAATLRDRGLTCQSVSREGDPEVVIIDEAKTWGADLIVVGDCHRSAIERLLAGSVSQGVVKHAPCSVLVIKPVQAQPGDLDRVEPAHHEPAPV